jgi:hypothetical protein
MNLIKKILQTTLVVLGVLFFAHSASASAIINSGGKSLCKTFADSSIGYPQQGGVPFDDWQYTNASAGDVVSIVGYAANNGNSSASVNYSISYQNTQPTTNHSFVVTVNGQSRTVYATTQQSVVLQLDEVQTITRVNSGYQLVNGSWQPVYPFSHATASGLPTSLNQTVPGGNFSFNCTGGYGNFTPSPNPNGFDFEKAVIWYYQVLQVQQTSSASLSISSSNYTLGSGVTPTLTVSGTNLSSCTISPGSQLTNFGNFPGGTGSTNVSVVGLNAGNYTFTLNCSSNNGSNVTYSPQSVTLNVQNAAPVYNPSVLINNQSNGSTSVIIGQTASLSVTMQDVQANSCQQSYVSASGNNPWVAVSPGNLVHGQTGSANLTASVPSTSGIGTWRIKVQCNGLNNQSVVAYHNLNTSNGFGPANTSVDVQVNNSNGPVQLTSGSPATVTYAVTGPFSYCTTNWTANSNVTQATGSTYFPSVTAGGTYQIYCYNNNGGSPVASDSVTVNVTNSPTNNVPVITGFSCNPDPAESGETVQCTLTSSNAQTCTLYGGFSNSYTVPSSNTISFNVTQSSNGLPTIYAYCSNSNGNSATVPETIGLDNGNSNDDWEIITGSPDDVESDSVRMVGEVDGEDNVDTWFVYSATDTTPECGDTGSSSGVNDEYVNVSGLFDNGDDFTKLVNDLDNNATYYYRACGKRGSEERSGSVKRFVTGTSNVVGPIQVTRSAPVVTTLLPSAVGGTSAGFAGTYSSPSCPATMWFEYTTVPGNFNQRTDTANKGAASFGSHTASANNLLSGITYYVRAVAQNCVSTTYGNTVSFRTVGAQNLTPIDNSGTTRVVTQQVVQYVGGGGGGSEWLKLDIENNVDTVFVGQTLQYVVQYENLTNSVLEDAEILVLFPKDLRVVGTSRGQIVRNDNAVVVDLGTIDGREKDEFTVTVKVRSIAAGTTVLGQANAAFDIPQKDIDDPRPRVTASDLDDDIVGTGSGFGAAAFGSGPFGLGLIGWLLLLLILALIYLIARYAAMARNRQYPYYQPVYTQPMQPMQQVYSQPMYQQPQPIYTQPVYAQPVSAQPVAPVAPVVQQVAAPEPELPTEEYAYRPYRPESQ